METLEPLLAKHPFFKDLSGRFPGILAGCASNVIFEAGDTIFREGGEADKFYLIREGHVAVEVCLPAGDPVILQTLGEGDVLGWSWLVEPYLWAFDARAVERTRALALDGVCLRRKCDENAELGYAMLKRFSIVMARRLQAARMQILDVYGDR